MKVLKIGVCLLVAAIAGIEVQAMFMPALPRPFCLVCLIGRTLGGLGPAVARG